MESIPSTLVLLRFSATNNIPSDEPGQDAGDGASEVGWPARAGPSFSSRRKINNLNLPQG
jgi:hypothetical protein